MDEYSSNLVADDSDIDVIDISKCYTFNQFMDELSRDNTKVFYSEGQLYFIKNDMLKQTSQGIQDTIYPLSEDVLITTSLMNQSFYHTNIKINHVISKIPHNEITNLLRKGYTLIHVNESKEYSLTFSIDKDNVSYCIVGSDNNLISPEDNNKDYETTLDILFNSFIAGTWFIIDSKED